MTTFTLLKILQFGAAQRLRTRIWIYLESGTLTFLVAGARSQWGGSGSQLVLSVRTEHMVLSVTEASFCTARWLDLMGDCPKERAWYSHNTIHDLALEVMR